MWMWESSKDANFGSDDESKEGKPENLEQDAETKSNKTEIKPEEAQDTEESVEISNFTIDDEPAIEMTKKSEESPDAKKSGHKERELPQDLPNKEDPLILHFENLTVHVPDKGCQCCADSCMIPLSRFGQEQLGMSIDYVESFDAIRNVSGYIREGETCLLLGPSGSGKSTLLRALCARLTENDELSGGIFINGCRLEEKHYQGWRAISSYVAATDNEHTPVLTVAETFRFAAECTSDGQRTKEEIEENVQKMLDVLGLSHVADTVVGDENLRGVSGGQKRRVTVGEMLMNRHSKFMCCDNITDGLASTDSIELISNISKACKQFGVAAIITLLQPSDEIVNQFDKLLVLGEGGELDYFGPLNRNLLREFFDDDESVSASGTTNDNGGICDLVLSHSISDKSKPKQNRFKESDQFKELMKKLSELRLFPLSESTYLENLLPNEKYHTPYSYQFKVIGYRRRKLIFRNAITYMRPCVAIFFGVIVGSLFSILEQDAMGALGRSGYLYLSCFLVFMLSTAVVVPEYFRERKTVFKHRSSEFYSGRVDYVTKMVWDFPLSVIEASIVAFVSYFWVGMNPGANHFACFWFTLIGLECVGQATARLLCSTIRVQLSAKTLTALLVFFCGAVSGFMPTYNEIPWIFRWMSWLNPVAYAFEAIMINEFYGRSMYGLVLTDPNEGSIKIGELSGNTWLDNQALPRVAWGDPDSIKVFDIFMLFIFGFVFDALGCTLIETTRGWYHNQVRKPQPKVAQTALSTAIESSVNSGKQSSSIMADTGNEEKEWPQSLTAVDLRYKVFIGSSRKCNIQSILGPCLARFAKTKTEQASERKEITLLNGITAQFKRGKMTALMGQSGAGKTTLMDVIAGYKTGGEITGEVLIDGCPKKDHIWKKISGYAEQNDILNPYLSVLETLQFTADCRLPKDADKQGIITSILQLMNLESYTTMLVGRELLDEGLPKHARKRLTIANQLINKPKILFLDEPTSGLGNNSAALVVGAMRRVTDAMGLITLATIHQPSRKMFETFDELLLVAKGGRVAYMGPLGYRSQHVLEHFAQLKGEKGSPPSSCNPADYVLSVLDNSDPDVAVSKFAKSTLREELDADVKFSKENPVECPFHNNLFQGNTTMQELIFLIKRHFIVQLRNPSYSIMRMSVSVGASLFLGILFYQISPTLNGAVFTIAAMNFFVFMLSIPMQGAIVPLVEDRAVLYREVVSGTYGRINYAIGQVIADLAFHALNTVLMFVSFYYLVGFRTEAEYVGYFILMLFLANWVSTSVGECFGYSCPNEETACGFSGLSTILSVIFMGFLITIRFMPNGWKWANWMNLFRYIMQGLVTNQLEGQEYKIDLGLGPDNSTNSSAIVFGPGTIPKNNNAAEEISRMISLVLASGPGTNNITKGFFDNGGPFSSWVDCMVANQCLVEPILSTFISCNIFNFPRGPACGEQFDTLTADLNVTQCLGEAITIDLFQQGDNTSQFDIVKCMLRNILPDVPLQEIVTGISTVVKNLYQIAMIVIDVIENGITLPANVILWFFGWGAFEDGEFIAPYKWDYCMVAVVIFLICVEILKLIAIRFIVWTKR